MESTTVAGALIFLMISGAARLILVRSGFGSLQFLDGRYNNAPNNRPSHRGR